MALQMISESQIRLQGGLWIQTHNLQMISKYSLKSCLLAKSRVKAVNKLCTALIFYV